MIRYISLAFIAVLVGIICSSVMRATYNSLANMTRITSADISKLSDGSYRLLVFGKTTPNRDCIRFAQHVLIREVGPDAREYVPLNMAQSGLGFGSTPDFKVNLFVPFGTPLGDWKYVFRSSYFCVAWPGLVITTQQRTPPIVVKLE